MPKDELETTSNPDRLLEAASMDQRDHEFVPRVLAVRSGQPVRFSNSDPANHNVRTSSSREENEFNVYTPAESSYTRRFVFDPQQRPVRVGCDIHPWMRGWVYVFDHPWFDVTDERGQFRIQAVADGEYTLRIRQPDIRFEHEQSIRIAKGVVAPVEIDIRANDLFRKRG
jgi:plastocyanin